MRILVTNDDGIAAPGLLAVVGALRAAGHDLAVAAPEGDRSGSGSGLGSIEHGTEVRYAEVTLPGMPDVEAVQLNAPPSFAVLASCVGLFGERPDIVVSGINDGFNTGRLLLTSSTVGAVLTAAGLGLRGLAISAGFAPHHRFDTAAAVAVSTVAWLIEESAERTVLNVNVPDLDLGDLRGVRTAPLAPRGLMGLHLERTADTVRLERYVNDRRLGTDTDAALVRDGFVTVSALSTVSAVTPGAAPPSLDPASGIARGLPAGTGVA